MSDQIRRVLLVGFLGAIPLPGATAKERLGVLHHLCSASSIPTFACRRSLSSALRKQGDDDHFHVWMRWCIGVFCIQGWPYPLARRCNTDRFPPVLQGCQVPTCVSICNHFEV